MPERNRNLAMSTLFTDRNPLGHGERSDPLVQRGYTLVELLTVMTVVGVLMAIGVPSFRYVTNNNRVSSEVNSLVGDLQFARGQAIKEGTSVVACVSTDGATCSTASPTSWSLGWIVFSDTNGDGVVSAGEVVRRVQRAFNSTDTFTSSPNTFQAISFNREGYATGIPANAMITLHDVNTTAKYTRCLSVSIVGQMNVLTRGQTPPGTGMTACS